MDLLGNDNDDNSIEGQIVQNLFFSSYDTDSNDDENDESNQTLNSKNQVKNNEQNEQNNINKSNTKHTNFGTIHDTTIQNQITCETNVQRCQYMHVVIEELCIGGSISHRVWPAAEFLATFILDVHRICQQKPRKNEKRQSLWEPNQPQHNDTIVTATHNVIERQSNEESNLHNSKGNEAWIEYYVKRFHRTNYQEQTQTQTQIKNNDTSFVENNQTKRQHKHQGCEEQSIRIAFHLLDDILNVQKKQQQYSEKQQQQELCNIDTAHDDNNTEDIQSNMQPLDHSIHILEIGAGVGLTGLELASQLCCKNTAGSDDDVTSIDEKKEKQSRVNVAVLLTDLETALPLLHKNIALNFDLTIQQQQQQQGDDDLGFSITTTDDCATKVCMMRTPVDAASLSSARQQQQIPNVHALKLDWSSTTDCMNALEWFQSISNEHNHVLDYNTQCQRDTSSLPSSLEQQLQQSLPPQPQPAPILIIGSDCVYWEALHEPLRCCLSTLLNNAPIGSICLLAGMRRWKRDTAFYNSINSYKGKKTNSTNTSINSTNDTSNGNKKSKSLQCVCLYEHVLPKVKDDDQREIMRIYAIYLSSNI